MRATEPIYQVVLAAVIGFGLLGALAFGVESCHRKAAEATEQQANIASGEAHAHQTQAQASDALVPHLQAKLDAQTADLGRITRERDELLRKLAAKPRPTANPANPGSSTPDPMGDEHTALIDDLQAVVAKDAELIAVQSGTIAVQSGLIQTLTVSRDEWKKTAEYREKQALAQQAAAESWKSAVKSSRWLGRGEGLLAGAALGLLGGRR